jgi:predicted DCC family thiol-disulfide oxidoreductase YuxK
VLFALVLVSRTARRILPVMMVATHLGILVLQRILFLDLIVLQLVFLDFAGIRKAIRRVLIMRLGNTEVLFDGSCALCRRTVRLLGALDVFGALQLQDFRRLDVDAYNRRHALNLRLADLDRSMHVVARGHVTRGFSAYCVIAKAVPLFWPLITLLFVPGISSLGEMIYARIAGHRSRLAGCDAGCAIEPLAGEHVLSTGARQNRSTFGFALTLSALVALAVACFALRLEFYPLTAWHLYAASDTSGKVNYYRVMGRHESGELASVRLEDGIGAYALDGRYMVAINRCFGQIADVSLCEKFLTANGAAYNMHRKLGNRLTQYEIQTWTWDFLSSPRDPDHGELVDRLVVDVTARGQNGQKIPASVHPSEDQSGYSGRQ